MEKRNLTKVVEAFTTMTVVTIITVSNAYADTTIQNPLSGKDSTVGSVGNGIITWVLAAVASFSGAWFVFHLYKAIMGFMAGAHHAQKREDAKSHLWHVAISGVLLGAAGVGAAALFNLGASFK